jgi:hypothetical protein
LQGLTALTFPPTLVATVEETVDDVTAPTNSARPGPWFRAMLTPKPGPGQDAQKLPKQLNPAHSTQRDDLWVKKEVCLVLGRGDSCSRNCCVLPAREHCKPEERRPILMQREGDRRVRPSCIGIREREGLMFRVAIFWMVILGVALRLAWLLFVNWELLEACRQG